jgi:TolB protein
VFFSDRSGREQLYVMDIATGAVTPLTEGQPGSNFAAMWSPSADKIAFVSDRTGRRELDVMNADGGDVVQLRQDADTFSMPAWSPDGKRIAYHSARTGRNEIWVMNADGSQPLRLTRGTEGRR